MCCASFEYPFLKNKAFVANLLKHSSHISCMGKFWGKCTLNTTLLMFSSRITIPEVLKVYNVRFLQNFPPVQLNPNRTR